MLSPFLEQMTPEKMAEEWQKDPIKSKVVRKYLLQFDRLTIKKGVLHHLYINNDVEYHQMVLPIKYQHKCLICCMMAKVIRGLKELLYNAGSEILLECHIPRYHQLHKNVHNVKQ